MFHPEPGRPWSAEGGLIKEFSADLVILSQMCNRLGSC